MSGLEIVGIVAGVVSAASGAAHVYRNWREERRERKERLAHQSRHQVALMRGQQSHPVRIDRHPEICLSSGQLCEHALWDSMAGHCMRLEVRQRGVIQVATHLESGWRDETPNGVGKWLPRNNCRAIYPTHFDEGVLEVAPPTYTEAIFDDPELSGYALRCSREQDIHREAEWNRGSSAVASHVLAYESETTVLQRGFLADDGLCMCDGYLIRTTQCFQSLERNPLLALQQEG